MKALIALLVSLCIAIPAQAAGGVYVNNGQVCSAGASMELTMNGDLSIVCGSAPVTPPPPPTDACTGHAAATWGSTVFDTDTPHIPFGGYVSYKLPVWTAAGKFQKFSAVNNGAGSGNDATHPLITQFVISKCPGDFTPDPVACQAFGDPMNGVLNLSTHSVAAPAPGCALVVGQQYYLNVRNVDANFVSTCQSGSCSEIVRLNGN